MRRDMTLDDIVSGARRIFGHAAADDTEAPDPRAGIVSPHLLASRAGLPESDPRISEYATLVNASRWGEALALARLILTQEAP